jgi:hypothetical protein
MPLRLPGFRHYNLRKQGNRTVYYGILLDAFKTTKQTKRYYTLDIYLGHHLYVVFWGNRVN